MVVCKFFLQGTCKFGTYCYNEHQVPTNYNFTNFTNNSQPSTSILRQSNFGTLQNIQQNAKPAATSANVDVNTLVKAVVTDMKGAEKGGQWLLSCYAPFKEKPAFPGFEDHSPEEIRFGFYEAQKNGTTEQYKQQLQILLQDAMAKITALQNPSQDIINILQQIYNTPVSNSNKTFNQSTSNANQQSANIFATQTAFSQQQNQNTNIFATKNIFTGTPSSQSSSNNIFATTNSPPNKNIFANSSNFVPTQTTNFGPQQPPASNIFATPQSNANVFAAPPFGSPPQQTRNNVFVPAAQQPQNIFTTQPSKFEQQNIFAVQNQTAQNAEQNIFSSQPQQNVFGQNTTMVQQNSVSLPNYTASIFGNTAITNPSLVGFGEKQQTDEHVYSKLEDLTEEDKKWFESDTLDILSIPDKPPTYDMCFKA